jgi:hypothetical protein
MIETGSHQSTQHRAQPVNPVVSCERCTSHTRAKATCRVHRCACEVDTSDFNDKEREADSNGRDEGVFGFLGGKHEYREDQMGGQELQHRKSDLELTCRFGYDYIPSRGRDLARYSCLVLAWSARPQYRME